MRGYEKPVIKKNKVNQSTYKELGIENNEKRKYSKKMRLLRNKYI